MNKYGVLFAMRYPDDVGYVWNTIARQRDEVAKFLSEDAVSYISYPELTGNPSYRSHSLTPICADFYDYSESNKKKLEDTIRSKNIRIIIYMSANPSSVDLSFLKQHAVYAVNTENNSYDHSAKNGIIKGTAKYVLRSIMKHGIYDLYIPNAASQKKFLRQYAKIPASRLAVISDGVDTSRFAPRSDDNAGNPSELDRAVTWVMAASQARPEKRLEFIIEAARRVILARPAMNMGFVHVGAGVCLDEWRALVLRHGLEDRFLFVGHKDDLVPYYQASAVFAHAASRESFGLVIVEAMSSSLPVVTTASAGPSETVVDGETGVVVEPDDIDGFVAGLIRYLDDPTLRASHGQKARDRAVNCFSIERQAENFADLLRTRFPDVFARTASAG